MITPKSTMTENESAPSERGGVESHSWASPGFSYVVQVDVGLDETDRLSLTDGGEVTMTILFTSGKAMSLNKADRFRN